MSSRTGHLGKVTLGANLIAGMGNWSMSGITTDLLEKTAFGDTRKQYVTGLLDSGEISFEGYYDPDDTNGQNTLRTYNEDNTEVTTIRFYIDSTSYYTPTTTNPLSYVLVTSYNVTADSKDILKTSFTCKVSGKMELI